MFNDYGGLRSFCGVIATVKVHEDNSLVRAALEEPGQGRVLVIDGGDLCAAHWWAISWRSWRSKTAGRGWWFMAAFVTRRRLRA